MAVRDDACRIGAMAALASVTAAHDVQQTARVARPSRDRVFSSFCPASSVCWCASSAWSSAHLCGSQWPSLLCHCASRPFAGLHGARLPSYSAGRAEWLLFAKDLFVRNAAFVAELSGVNVFAACMPSESWAWWIAFTCIRGLLHCISSADDQIYPDFTPLGSSSESSLYLVETT
jgi:hypothetical protein